MVEKQICYVFAITWLCLDVSANNKRCNIDSSEENITQAGVLLIHYINKFVQSKLKSNQNI